LGVTGVPKLDSKYHYLVEYLLENLNEFVKKVPDGFYDSFAFTKTGNNLTHPFTWGEIVKILSNHSDVSIAAIDVRLNNNDGIKFQPDVICYDKNQKVLMYVDYESPNSSDARIPQKDVNSYIRWRKLDNAPYVIITTLPNYSASKWKLLHTGQKQYNFAFKANKAELLINPYKFWDSFYCDQFNDIDMTGVYILNISGNEIFKSWPKA